MTQLETLQHARQYLDQLSQGVDPITQELLAREDPLAAARLQKCFAYVTGFLSQVIANEGRVVTQHNKKPPFFLSEEEAAQVVVTRWPIPIKLFVSKVNACVDTQVYSRLPSVIVTDWLVDEGYLIDVINAQNRYEILTTPLGQSIGITSEDRVTRAGVPFVMNLYNIDAQRFLLKNMRKIAATQAGPAQAAKHCAIAKNGQL